MLYKTYLYLCRYSGVMSVFWWLSSHLGSNPTRPKPSRPKTDSAQNQVGPKPTRPKTHSALDYEIFLLSSSLSSFLFLLLSFSSSSSSSIVCIMHWELISLKEVSIQKDWKSGDLEHCNFLTVTVMWIKVYCLKSGDLEHCNFLTVTVMWIKVYCLEWEWVRESVFDIRDTKNADFFSQKMAKNHFIIYLFYFFFQKMANKTLFGSKDFCKG